MKKLRGTAFIYLLFVSLIWGAASPVVKHTLSWFDPWMFLTYRFFISSLIAVPYLTLAPIPRPRKPALLWLLFAAAFFSAPLSLFLYFQALDMTTALSGSLITAAGPLLLIAGGVIFFRDRITKHEKQGIAVVLAGTLFTVVGPLITNGQSDTLGKVEGNAVMLAAVITDIVGALLCKEAIKKGVHPNLIANVQFILGFVLYLPVLVYLVPAREVILSIAAAPAAAHAGVLYMALVSGTLAYTLRNIAIKSMEVSESALYVYLQPLWAAMLAVFWLRESITASYILGGIVIAAGVWIAERKN